MTTTNPNFQFLGFTRHTRTDVSSRGGEALSLSTRRAGRRSRALGPRTCGASTPSLSIGRRSPSGAPAGAAPAAEGGSTRSDEPHREARCPARRSPGLTRSMPSKRADATPTISTKSSATRIERPDHGRIRRELSGPDVERNDGNSGTRSRASFELNNAAGGGAHAQDVEVVRRRDQRVQRARVEQGQRRCPRRL